MGSGLAVARWLAKQLLRAEIGSHLRLVAVATVAIVLPSLFVITGDRLQRASETRFGNASHQLVVFGADNALLERDASSVAFVEAQVDVSIDGLGDTVLVVRDPGSSDVGLPSFERVEGRFPTELGEVAVARSAVSIAVGQSLETNLGTFRVVGIVEDPTDLDRDFLAAAPGTFEEPDVTRLFLTEDPVAVFGAGVLDNEDIELVPLGQPTAELFDPFVVALFSLIGIVQLCLVSAAGFVVIGHRRLRQTAIVWSLGATSKTLRRSAAGNGFVVGLVASILGLSLSAFTLALANTALSERLGIRLNARWFPWSELAALAALVVASTTVAGWWPIRRLRQDRFVDALSAGRPPGRPSLSRVWARSLTLAVGALTLGGSLATGSDAAMLLGSFVFLIGVLICMPVALDVIGRSGGILPLGARLATRNLARSSDRTGPVLIALVVALGFPALVVVTSQAADANLDELQIAPNLPDSVVIVWDDAARYGTTSELQPQVSSETLRRRLQAVLPDVVTAPVRFATFPADGPGQVLRSVVVPIGGDIEHPGYREAPVWILDEPLSGLLGVAVDGAYVAPEATVTAGALTGSVVDDADELALLSHRSLPGLLVPKRRASELTLGSSPVGVIARGAQAFTDADIVLIQDALPPGFTVEARSKSQEDRSLRNAATGTGVASAAALLALCFSLLRIEAAAEVSVFRSIGAPPRLQRTIAATEVLILSALAAVPSLVIAYGSLLLINAEAGGEYPVVLPVALLSALFVGLPLVCASVAYAFGAAGRGS